MTHLAGAAFGGVGGLGLIGPNAVFFGTLAGIGYIGYRLASPAYTFSAATNEIDWPAVQDWHACCEAQGLKNDRRHSASESLAAVLSAICTAGRA